jgi:hypothetical protein
LEKLWSLLPSRENFGFFLLITSSITLIGATSYYLITKKYKLFRKSKRVEPFDDDDQVDTQTLYDDILGQNAQRSGQNSSRMPALITFQDLHERALTLNKERAQ